MYREKNGCERSPSLMNKRQYDLLRTLYDNKGFLTLSEIAEGFNVSAKTVRNDIAAIKEYLAEYECGTLETKPHIGVRAVITDEEWSKLSKNTNDDSEDREIMFFIIRSLMKKSCLTAQRLAEQYYIGRTQLNKILDKIAEWFSENHILLEVRRGKGLSISYSEFNYRMAMLKLFSEFWDMYTGIINLRRPMYTLMPDEEYTGMCAALNGFNADNVAKILLETEEKFGIKFNYTSNKNLIFLISLSILRYNNGINIQMPKVSNCNTDGLSDDLIADDILQRLADTNLVKFNEEEKAFIKFAVSISEIQNFSNDEYRHQFEQMNFELCRLTVRMINIINEIADLNLMDDSHFVKEMFLLMKSMISRLKYGVILKNSLLPQIKQKYPNTMAIAWSLENLLEKELKLEINEHDVGLLALYIGGAIERKLSGVTACIVCDYGIGTSQILKEKITRLIPELRITSIFSIRDINQIKNDDCDFIISTVSLDGYRLNKDVLTIKYLLDNSDLRMIETYLTKIKKQKKVKVNSIQPSASLFKKDLIFTGCRMTNKKEILKEVCQKLECLGYVTEDFEKSVLDREKCTSTDIGKGIAIPHGHSDYVNHSAVAFISLDKPIKWSENGEYIDLIFLLAFDMGESDDIKEKIVKFFKSVVVFTENDSVCEKLKSTKESEKILKIFEQW